MKIKISNKLTETEIKLWNIDKDYKLPEELLSTERIEYLMWHNEEFEKRESER